MEQQRGDIDLDINVIEDYISSKADLDMDKVDNKDLFIKLIAESGI